MVFGHFLENPLRKWPAILHAHVSWPPSKLVRLWLQFVDFSNFGAIWTQWNGSNLGFPGILVVLCGFSSLLWPFDWKWSYFGFLGIIWRMCGSKCRGGSGGIFPTLCVEFCLVYKMICSLGWRLQLLILSNQSFKDTSICDMSNMWNSSSVITAHHFVNTATLKNLCLCLKWYFLVLKYRQVSNTRCALVGNRIKKYIFILDLTSGFIALGKDNCKTRRETFKFNDMVHLI